MKQWEIRDQHWQLHVAPTELECWLRVFGKLGKEIDFETFMTCVSILKRIGVKAVEVEEGCKDD